ncbi:hypothetical protein [Actinokineospora sp. UTMC 2448]|uniref:hypothetical protein n=1 Tax=Actinokineospora sp. UTMC 2448 TaxID=2268449 RepID=UPI002164D440|nr:hypothetical protein [Actinokineospora sp. UTMC 2448]UVS82129.1 hypothetical protein Actkin_05894 [Actinokineospora sp. UTMC 2448]
MAVSPAQRGVVHKVLPLVLVLGALGFGVMTATGTRPVAVLPSLCFAAAVVAALSPAGRTLPGRIALGVVLVTAAAAITAVFVTTRDSDLTAVLIGLALLAVALVWLLSGETVRAAWPVTAYAPAVAAVSAALLMAVRFVQTSAQASSLLHGGLSLLIAVLLAVASGTAGPARFALGALGVALSAALVYFLAIGGPGVPAIALAAVAAVAAVAAIGPLDKSRSAESSDARLPVR